MHAPNTPATFAVPRSEIEAVVAQLAANSKLTLKHLGDPLSRFAVLTTLSPAPAPVGLATALAV